MQVIFPLQKIIYFLSEKHKEIRDTFKWSQNMLVYDCASESNVTMLMAQ